MGNKLSGKQMIGKRGETGRSEDGAKAAAAVGIICGRRGREKLLIGENRRLGEREAGEKR